MYNISVNSRNIHSWSWSLDSGAENHVPAGQSSAEAPLEEESVSLYDIAGPLYSYSLMEPIWHHLSPSGVTNPYIAGLRYHRIHMMEGTFSEQHAGSPVIDGYWPNGGLTVYQESISFGDKLLREVYFHRYPERNVSGYLYSSDEDVYDFWKTIKTIKVKFRFAPARYNAVYFGSIDDFPNRVNNYIPGSIEVNGADTGITAYDILTHRLNQWGKPSMINTYYGEDAINNTGNTTNYNVFGMEPDGDSNSPDSLTHEIDVTGAVSSFDHFEAGVLTPTAPELKVMTYWDIPGYKLPSGYFCPANGNYGISYGSIFPELVGYTR